MSMMKTLTVNGVTYKVINAVPTDSVTLLASAWKGDGDRYSQVVEVPGVTAHTKVDLQPTSEQLEEFHYKILAFVAENEGGIVTVYSIGDKPDGDHTIQITKTEVEGTGKIRGNTVGTTMPRPDWNQTDPTKADYIKNKPDYEGRFAELETQISEEMAKKEQLTPEYADSIEGCTDTSKLYVLPDGYIYAYMNKSGALFTNQLINAIDTDGTPYNGGLGYKMGYYIGSQGNEGAHDGCLLAGYIPIADVTKLVLRVSGYKSALNTQCQMKFYNSSFENIKLDNTDLPSVQVEYHGATFELEPAFNNEVYTFKYDYSVHKTSTPYYSNLLANGDAKYVRISISNPDVSKVVVTINEEIAFGSEQKWQNTGHAFIPADYEERIIPLEKSSENHETRIRTLEMYGADSPSATDVPAYIKAEADAVMSRLIEKQGNRNFTMIAMSDFHYSGMGNNKDNLIRACKAISYIADRLHVDAIATLGDNLPNGSTYDDTIRATADRWAKEINEILAVTQKPGVVDFRTPGNHDRFGTPELFMPDNAIYSFISGYNRQCDYVDVPGGWAYRDFPGHNLRIIVLNTAEVEGKGRFEIHAGYHMSTKQYEWLVNTLDMSGKPNASDWQILILSHHKADDWQVAATNASTNNYILPNILNAYDTGGSYTGVNAEDGKTISCNFSGKNSARLIGQIHGHHHAYIYGNICLSQSGSQTNVMAISTPTSGFGSGEGHNDDNDGNWYDSVKDTAEETAFCVYSIDLDNHVIHAIHYGNGVDREIEY